jgi:hypothetical protein
LVAGRAVAPDAQAVYVHTHHVLGAGPGADNRHVEQQLRGTRVPYDFAELYYNYYGTRLDPQNVFPKGIWNADLSDNTTAKLHQFGLLTISDASVAYAAVDGALLYSYAPVILVSNAGITGNYTGTVAATNQAGATKTVTLTALVTLDTADSQHILGACAISTTSAAAQKVVTCSGVQASAAFTAGEWVLLADTTNSIMELAQVDSIATNSLTMKTNLLHTFTQTDQVFAWPLYTNVTAFGASTSGEAAEYVQVYARPDRAIVI